MAYTTTIPLSSTPLLQEANAGKQIPPTFKPLTEKFEKRALRYIEACETQPDNNGYFMNFEHQVKWRLDEVPENGDVDKIGQSFVELVIFEVQLKNLMSQVPFWNLRRKSVQIALLIEYRWRSRYLWGRTTKYHAKIYREFINNELAKRSITQSFPVVEEEDDDHTAVTVVTNNLSS